MNNHSRRIEKRIWRRKYRAKIRFRKVISKYWDTELKPSHLQVALIMRYGHIKGHDIPFRVPEGY